MKKNENQLITLAKKMIHQTAGYSSITISNREEIKNYVGMFGNEIDELIHLFYSINSKIDNGGSPILKQIIDKLMPDRFSFTKPETEPVGEFESLNFVIDHESLDFTGYEFEGKEIFIDEHNDTQSLFRMDVDKETEEITVYAAYSGDFDIMEDVTMYFDTNKLSFDIFKWTKTHDVENQGAEFVAYCEAIDNGMECEDAISYAYESVRATEPLKLGSNIIVIEVND